MKKIIFVLVLFLFGCSKTIVAFDEDKQEFIFKEGKKTEGTISLEKGDNCQIYDVFVVCGQ